MEFLNGKIKPIYFKYLSASFGTALIASVYSIVDVAMVGQYQGPEGTAALAVVAPLWNIIYSLGLLVGIGGSVLFSARRGGGRGDGSENQYFTAAAIGADESLLALAQRYMQPIKPVFPLFLLNQLLAGFLRNDGNPGLATMSVLAGGIFNVFGDYFFVFPCDMGVYGAGLATAIGSGISFLVMLIHFVSRKNTLRLVRPERLGEKLRAISVTGFSTFFVDVAMGILTVLFNRQIMRWLGSDAMAVYGPIIQISTFAQCCAYSVGQASQPIISMNYGAAKAGRIRQTLRLALYTVAFFSIFWTALSLACPNFYIRIFMSPTPAILAIAPAIIRTYALSFPLLPLNIFSTYYFQAIMKPGAAFIVSVARGLVVSGALILALPAVLGANALWLAMPITELLVAIYTVAAMKKYTKTLPATGARL